ncbi:hypothetical protein AJ80_09253 [Polytolypa hystricis UAMH7299]|uniref:EamA domain-containing protein n=1 Tax=Polytolypa hystricis (strain UAMH7299) TaxID=1447883 RepID=A0A2B7WT91_POLH7|nr:hypothetical protein AJ80_09253 [Polytolypa hystricis UAMH7299]
MPSSSSTPRRPEPSLGHATDSAFGIDSEFELTPFHSSQVSGPRQSISPPLSASPSFDIELQESRQQGAQQQHSLRLEERHGHVSGTETDDSDNEMPIARPPLYRPTDGRSQESLLKDERRGRELNSAMGDEEGGSLLSAGARRTFRSRTPEYNTKDANKRKYLYASFFLVVSLISFVIQTETAVYIQRDLGWDKPYCMLYLTHGSWVFLYPAQLLVLRFQKRKLSWGAFWRRHVFVLRSTAQMVESQDLHLKARDTHKSPVPYMLRTTALVTTALTVAGGSWYVAVKLTTPSDLTAIYNCSAFFAYAFSIPLLKDKLRFDKVFSVLVAIVGVLIVAYGPTGDNPDGSEVDPTDASDRTLGNLIIGVGSILYGLYEVLYKRYACPPEGASPGRGVVFANTFASLIGAFTLLVLWIPIPILHILGLEPFEWPQGKAGNVLLVSVFANATFSGSFLVLISLTSPVLSSVAALLTIFLVALVDWKLTGKPLTSASIMGGILIIIAFLLLSWSTYRELDEERRRRLSEEGPDSNTDD